MLITYNLFATALLAAKICLAHTDHVCDDVAQELGALSSAGSVLLQKQLERDVASALTSPLDISRHSTKPASKRRSPFELLAEVANISVKSTLGIELPPWLQNKMVLPNPWKCSFAGDTRACDMNAMQAGLAPYGLTQEGRARHEYQNYPRVFMPVGAVPCCTTPPFCSAPKCADDFITFSKTAPPLVCTKRPAHENFAYLVGQETWPAYIGYAGGNSFDVHKHWDVLGRILGCAPGAACTSAKTMDLVIDIGSNFGGISEELALRHFAKSFILIDAAPFAGPDFSKRFGNSSWRQEWFQQSAPSLSQAVVPEFEFLNMGVSSIPGIFDPCTKFAEYWIGAPPCPIEKGTPDSAIPAKLSQDFQLKFAEAQSAFVKIDVEGYDHLAIQGMTNLLQETRGVYPDGLPKHLVNFMMLEYAPVQMGEAKLDEQLVGDYDLKNITTFLESQGFEVFLIGPRYLPLTHGSWDDQFRDWFADLGQKSQAPHCPGGSLYPNFKYVADCVGPWEPSVICDCSFATDLFAMRASHPNAAEIKLNLGACTESKDFDAADPQYDMSVQF